MKFSEQWLREWVPVTVSTEELAHQLTMAGLEVEAVEPVAARFSGVVAAEVLTTEPHPDSDHLTLCRVRGGTDEPLDIVCGAPNVRAGMRVPLAKVGAELPNGLRITPAKVRGYLSSGMLCSASELGLVESKDGLMELSSEFSVGTELWSALGLDDHSIELNVTANRGDCLGLIGVAREVGVINRCPVVEPGTTPVTPSITDTFPLEIVAEGACPSYAGRVVRGVNASAETPMWMRERLRRSGLRSINPIVDITNYVMLEFGQPMHAFDLGQLQDRISVRYATASERIVLLDGQALELDTTALVIADGSGPLALAGIMGGQHSGVSSATTDIFFESAFFTPAAMAGQARRFRLQTDSSYRFERGVDFELQARAIERATTLLLSLCGGRPGPLITKRADALLPQRNEITLRRARLAGVLGRQIPAEEVIDTLTRLGMTVQENTERWVTRAPSFRFDIEIEADLIEEVARISGYAAIPSALPRGEVALKASAESQVPGMRLRSILVERGYHEAITYSFVDPHWQSLLDPDTAPLALMNPMAADMSVMRSSLWPGLLQAVRYNLNRQHERVRLFELGLAFKPGTAGLAQERCIAGVVSGLAYPEQWGAAQRAVDFFDLKGDVAALLGTAADSTGPITFTPAQHPALHPGQAAAVRYHDRVVGYLGRLHPTVQGALELSTPVYLFELEHFFVEQRTLPRFEPLSRFPLVRRDIAVVVDRGIDSTRIVGCVRQAVPETLTDLQLFDVYCGEGIDPMKKSIALGLIFQGTSSTLIDSDVDLLVEQILSKLKQELGAQLRS